MLCQRDDGPVVVKFYIKRHPEFSLTEYERRLDDIQRKFSLDAAAQPGESLPLPSPSYIITMALSLPPTVVSHIYWYASPLLH